MSFSTELHETAESGVREIVEGHAQGQAKSNRHMAKLTKFVLAMGALMVISNLLLFGFAFYKQATAPVVTLSAPQLLGPTSLCPGETLDYSFAMAVSTGALVELKTSVQKLQPGARISYARLQEFDFLEATTLEFVRHWVTPPTYSDPVSGTDVPWEPGPYEQITIANVAGRSQESKVVVPFEIRNDCKGR